MAVTGRIVHSSSFGSLVPEATILPPTVVVIPPWVMTTPFLVKTAVQSALQNGEIPMRERLRSFCSKMWAGMGGRHGRPMSLPVAMDVIVVPLGTLKVVWPPGTMCSARCLSEMRRHTLDAAVSPRGVSAEVGVMMSGALRVAGKLMLFNDLTAVLVFLATRDHQSFPVLAPIVHL